MSIRPLCANHAARKDHRAHPLRLRQLEIFYQVYRAGSISSAACNLSVSQPSVSKVLRHAEDQLGISLFESKKGRLVPTPAAHELFRDAEDIYGRLAQFSKSLAHIASRRQDQARLGMLPSLSLSVGPECVARLREMDPQQHFDLHTFHTGRITHELVERRCDLCLGFEAGNDRRLISKAMGEGSPILLSGVPLGEPDAVFDLSILHKKDFVGIRDSGPLGMITSALLLDRGVVPNEVATTDTYHLALSLVRKPLGVAVTDQFPAYFHLGSGLHRYRPKDVPRFEIFASCLADHPDPQLLRRVTDAFANTIQYLDAGIARLQNPGA